MVIFRDHRPYGFKHRGRYRFGDSLYRHHGHRRFHHLNHGRYGLPAPGRGKAWVRDGGDALLIGITTGVILGIALSDHGFHY